MPPPEICPHCGADVPPNAKACPECGSDETTGWSEDTERANLGLPDENFSYDEFVKEEFGGKQVKPRGIHWVWWLVAVFLLLIFLYGFLR
jgi:uncharacterized membrane protein YvbJ